MRRSLVDVFGDEPPGKKKPPVPVGAAAPSPPNLSLRPGAPIGPPAPTAQDIPDLYHLLGGALHEGLRGFLQGVPQAITAARNEASAQPARPEVSPASTAPQINPTGGVPLGNLGALDWSRIGQAFTEGYGRETPPVPHALRNMLGTSRAAGIADYALDFTAPETGFLLGPAYQATVGAGLTKLGAAAQKALTPALRTALGQLISRKGLLPLGVGPSATMMREVTKPYEQQVAVRLQEGGQIAREMRKTMQHLRLADPVLDAHLAALSPTDPGPLQRLAQKYAVLNLQHGPQSVPNSIDNQAIAIRASVEGVPYAEVKKYGEQLLAHMHETLGDLYAAGATPFIKARGKSFYNPLPTSPPSPAQVVSQMRTYSAARAAQNPSYAQLVATASRQNSDPLFQAVQVYNQLMTTAVQAGGAGLSPQDRGYLRAIALANHLNVKDIYRFGERYMKAVAAPAGVFSQLGVTGIPKSAKPLAEDALRRKFAGTYLAQLFASEKPQVLGQVGAAAYTGSGIKEVRRAGVRGLVQRLADPADPISHYLSDVHQPGTVQVKKLRAYGAALQGKYLPEPLYNYLTHEIGEVGLVGPAGQKVYTKYGQQAGALIERGKRGWAGLGTALEKYAGLQKKVWIGNFSTAASNIVSNQAAVEIAARREGFPLAAFMAELPAAGQEVMQYKLSGRPSADIAGLRQFSRSFVETQAATAALAGKKGPRELAGLTGRIFTLPGGKRVLAPTAGEVASRLGNSLVALHDYPEKAYKLALYKVLAPKLGPEGAAHVVEKYLFDYSDRGALLETLDQHGLWVFNAFPTKATALLLDTLVHRPDLVARYPRLQAQLMQEAPGAKGRYGKLPEYAKGDFTLPRGQGFVDLSRQHVFGDSLKTTQETVDAIREGRLPDYLKPDELANLQGHVAWSPILSALENRRFYGSTAHPVRISPIGAPMEQQVGDGLRELLYQMGPGFARGIADYRAASAGIPPKPGKRVEAKHPDEIALQSILGIRAIPGETLHEKEKRIGQDPARLRERQDAGTYRSQAKAYIEAHPELNPYRKDLQRIQNETELDVQFYDARKYLRSLKGSGPLTDDLKRKINEAVSRYVALKERRKEIHRAR